MLEDGRDLTCSHLLLCIGMRPNTSGPRPRPRPASRSASAGTLPADEFCRTNVPHIYACGDVTGQIMLANTASLHGRTAALHALGVPVEPVAYTGVAWCVFTRPEIAKAGISERQARLDGMHVRVTKHLVRANPRAVMEGETDGMIKLLSDPDDGTILGGAMVGLRASEVITAVALAVHARLSVQMLAETAAVNPSMSESLQRAAEKAAEGMLGISRVTLSGDEKRASPIGPSLELDRRSAGAAISIGPEYSARGHLEHALGADLGRHVGEQQAGDAGPGRLAAGLGRVHVAALAGVVVGGVARAPPRTRTGRRRGRSGPAARSGAVSAE